MLGEGKLSLGFTLSHPGLLIEQRGAISWGHLLTQGAIIP